MHSSILSNEMVKMLNVTDVTNNDENKTDNEKKKDEKENNYVARCAKCKCHFQNIEPEATNAIFIRAKCYLSFVAVAAVVMFFTV